MIEELNKTLLKEIAGRIVTIGVKNDTVMKTILDCPKVYACDILEKSSKGSKVKGANGKTVNVKHLRKDFKHKKVDFLIADIKDLEKHIKHFVKESIYVTNTKIYIYGKLNKEKLESLIKKYERYDVAVDLKKHGANFILNIDVSKANNNKIADTGYLIQDSLAELSTIISDILVK